MIYFDHNATTPVDERVLEAMLPYLQTFYGNASSLYRLGRISRSAIETAREQLAELVDAQPSQIIFTSGGTEANNLALSQIRPASAVAVSTIEHPSIIEPVMGKRSVYRQLSLLEVNSDGLLDFDAMAGLEFRKNDFVSLMLANNETGAIQDVARLVGYFNGQGVVVHTDAVQALGKIPVSFSELGVQMMSLSSHKIYGPKGCGALVIGKGAPIHAQISGGGQEQGHRAGTENVAAIVGFGKAAELIRKEWLEQSRKILELRQYLEQKLSFIPDTMIFSQYVERLPNTVLLAINGVEGEMLLMQLDQENIAVSSGSACSSGTKSSPVLAAMGVSPELSKSVIRISLGKVVTKEDIDIFIQKLTRILRTVFSVSSETL